MVTKAEHLLLFPCFPERIQSRREDLATAAHSCPQPLPHPPPPRGLATGNTPVQAVRFLESTYAHTCIHMSNACSVHMRASTHMLTCAHSVCLLTQGGSLLRSLAAEPCLLCPMLPIYPRVKFSLLIRHSKRCTTTHLGETRAVITMYWNYSYLKLKNSLFLELSNYYFQNAVHRGQLKLLKTKL